MDPKKQNGLPRLKKVNIVDPERNTAVTMYCYCSCSCNYQSYDANWNTTDSLRANLMNSLEAQGGVEAIPVHTLLQNGAKCVVFPQ